MSKFTIFSLNLNNYLDSKLHQLCVDSWYEWKNNNSNIKDIIIFNEDSKEYKEFLNIYNSRKYKNKCEPQRIANAFRIYILSKNENYLWLDLDMYLNYTNLDWNIDFCFRKGAWSILYNGINLNFFKQLFSYYLTDNIDNLKDKQVSNKYKLPTTKLSEVGGKNYIGAFTHLNLIEDNKLGKTIKVTDKNFEIIKNFIMLGKSLLWSNNIENEYIRDEILNKYKFVYIGTKTEENGLYRTIYLSKKLLDKLKEIDETENTGLNFNLLMNNDDSILNEIEDDYKLLNSLKNKKINNIKDITIFSLNLRNYFDLPVQKICTNTWYEWKKNNSQIKDIVIYDENSPEYKEFNELFKDKTFNYKDWPAQEADVFRIYILSKYKNYMWLDGDIYITNTKIVWDIEFLFQRCFCCLFNGNNTEFYKRLLNKYLENNLTWLSDTEFCTKYSNLTEKFLTYRGIDSYMNSFTHLCMLDNEKSNVVIRVADNNKTLLQNLKNECFYIMSNVYRNNSFNNVLFNYANDTLAKYVMIDRNSAKTNFTYVSDKLYRDLNTIKDSIFINLQALEENFDNTEIINQLEVDYKNLKAIRKLVDLHITNFDKMDKIITNWIICGKSIQSLVDFILQYKEEFKDLWN